MSAILHYLSSAFAMQKPADNTATAGPAEQADERWFCEHGSDLPAARDDDAWIRSDSIRTGRLA